MSKKSTISAASLHKEWMDDPEYRVEYEAMEEEFALAHKLIEARSRAKLTQADIAQRMGTTQSVISRLESGRQRPSMETLHRFASAVGCKVEVSLVPEGNRQPRARG